MRTRPFIIALGAATVAAIGLAAPAGAATTSSTPKPLDKIAKAVNQAAADGDDCSITGFGPQKVVLGIKPKSVRFSVSTDCDDADHQVRWAVTGELYPTSHVGWFGACTYTYTGPASLTCPDGTTTLNVIGTGQFKGNDMAGVQNAYVYAFDDANGNNRDDDTSYECDDDGNCTKKSSGRDNATKSLELLRRTGWGTSFAASHTEVTQGGQVTLTGRLTAADWDTGTNQPLATAVKLQFRATGASTFHTVRTVQGEGDSVSTTVSAKRSGSFRFVYQGDAEHARSASGAVGVTVTR
ncbi:hypothetical protein KIH74_28975 [Kineosporia sp. J2-2]|uniref:Uncharacterized protein n=1 Tax=Kineosporia corallincola TaxID=2835133 RepID=A0ABS5TPI8_9ACTN|nr:hypothetical protein [Kineosporia corallincola]MBT0773011.1 hypothetical protein [Kineosporia corallincola]